MSELDQRFVYLIRDKTEVFWKFVWEKIADVTGWWVWKKSPGDEKFFCQGTIQEVKVISKLNETPPALTQDERIDLGLWLDNGGLDEYIPDPNKEFPEEEDDFKTVAEMTGWVPPDLSDPALGE